MKRYDEVSGIEIPVSLGDEPAFPCGASEPNCGLTKRELAGFLAMQGLLASSSPTIPSRAVLAKYSREFADALLLELETK